MVSGIGSFYGGFIGSCGIDYEYEQIKKRLEMYGQKPSGNKYADKARLHEIELREAQKENVVTSKFLTVSKSEQEKIQQKKKDKKNENNQQNNSDTTVGAKTLGEQIYLAIQMKKRKKSSNVMH